MGVCCAWGGQTVFSHSPNPPPPHTLFLVVLPTLGRQLTPPSASARPPLSLNFVALALALGSRVCATRALFSSLSCSLSTSAAATATLVVVAFAAHRSRTQTHFACWLLFAFVCVVVVVGAARCAMYTTVLLI